MTVPFELAESVEAEAVEAEAVEDIEEVEAEDEVRVDDFLRTRVELEVDGSGEKTLCTLSPSHEG